jgi:hypothetical protein
MISRGTIHSVQGEAAITFAGFGPPSNTATSLNEVPAPP